MERVGPNEGGSSTYKLGEGSGVSKDGPADGFEGFVGLGYDLNQSPQSLVQANSLNRVAFQPNKVRPAQADHSLPCDVSLTSEKMMRIEYSYGAITNGVTWFIQLADDRRLALPECPILRWPPISFSSGVVSQIRLMQGFELGVSQCKFDGRGYEDKETVVWMAQDPIVVEPLSMVVPHVEENTTKSRAIPRKGFYQNPPSDWVLGQLKEFGRCVGPSYVGYEDEVIALLQKIEARRPQ